MGKRSKGVVPSPRVRDMRRILVRVPADLADWVDAAADEFGLSRDLFVRQLLMGCREGFISMGKDGSPEKRLLSKLQRQVTDAIKQGVDESLNRVVQLSESGVRHAPPPRRRS